MAVLLLLVELDEGAPHDAPSVGAVELDAVVGSPGHGGHVYGGLLLANLAPGVQFLPYSGVPEEDLAVFTDGQELVVHFGVGGSQ